MQVVEEKLPVSKSPWCVVPTEVGYEDDEDLEDDDDEDLEDDESENEDTQA